jgi:hypothetical protein
MEQTKQLGVKRPKLVDKRDALANERDAFVFFSFLWGAAMLVHMFARHRSWLHLGSEHLISYLLVLAALLVVLKPSSLKFLSFMLIVDVVHAFDQMPRLPNHILITAVVGLTMLIAMAEQKVRTRGPLDRGVLMMRLRPLLCIMFMLLYVFAALAKMNRDFFNLDVSCGSSMYLEMAEHLKNTYGIALPTARWMLLASVWGTVILETALPVMLFLRGWRKWAVLIGGFFHLALALHPVPAIFSFTAMMLALYFLFLPNDFATRIKEQWRALSERRGWKLHQPQRVRRAAIAGLAALAFLAAAGLLVYALRYDQDSWGDRIRDYAGIIQEHLGDWVFHLFFVCALLALVGVAVAMWRMPMIEESARRKFAPPATLGLLGVCLLFLMGMSPYLGLRTELAVAMFSNLRTEGGRTNHLFMPRWHIAGYQDDVVELIEFTLPDAGRDANDMQLGAILYDRLLLTWFDFRVRLSGLTQPFQVRYLRNGTEYFLDSTLDANNELCRPPSLLAAKLLDFRPFEKEGPMLCRH